MAETNAPTLDADQDNDRADAAPDTSGETGSRRAKVAAGARKAADTVRSETQGLKQQATEKAHALASEGKDKATDALDGVSRLINDAATSVEDQVGERYGAFARTAADTVAGFASQLREKDVEEIIDDARDFVRKSPVVAIGAAAAIGFVLARLVRAGVEANAASATDATSRSGSTTTGKRSGAA